MNGQQNRSSPTQLLSPAFLGSIAKNLNFNPPKFTEPPLTVETLADKTRGDQCGSRDTYEEILNLYNLIFQRKGLVSTRDKGWFANHFGNRKKTCKRFVPSPALSFLFDHLSSRIITTFTYKQTLPDNLATTVLTLAQSSLETAFPILTGEFITGDFIEFLSLVLDPLNHASLRDAPCSDVTIAMITTVSELVRQNNPDAAFTFVKSLVDEVRANCITIITLQWVRSRASFVNHQMIPIMLHCTDLDERVSAAARQLYRLAIRYNINCSTMVFSQTLHNALTNLEESPPTGRRWAQLMMAFSTSLDYSETKTNDVSRVLHIAMHTTLPDRDKFAAVTVLILISLHHRAPRFTRYQLLLLLALAENPEATDALKKHVTLCLLTEAHKSGGITSFVTGYLADVATFYASQWGWDTSLLEAIRTTIRHSSSR